MALVMLTDQTAKQAAKKLGMRVGKDPKQSFTRYFRNGDLPARKVGRYWFFDLDKIRDGQQ